MLIGIACSNPRSTFDFARKCQFCVFKLASGWSYIDRFTCILLGHVLETHSNNTLLLFKMNEDIFEN